MKRKLLFVSLVVALSTVGYAFDTVGGKVQDVSGKAEWNTGTIDNINDNLNSVVTATDKNFTEVQNKLNGKLDKTEADKTFATKGELKDEVTKIEIENSIQNGRLDEAEKKLDQKADYSDLAAVEADKNAIKEDLDKTKVELGNKLDKTEADKTFATKGELKDEVTKIEIENSIQNGRLDEAEKKLDQKADYSDLAAVEADKNAIKEDLDKTKAEIGKNKEEQGKVDATQNDRLDKVEAGKVDKETYKADKDAQADKDNKQDAAIGNKVDKETYKADKDAQADKDNKQDAAIGNKVDKETYKADMEKFQGQMNNYGSRIDNLEKRVDNLDNKLNKGLSLMAAMNAVDFQDVAEGEMAIGAGVGHYGNAQSVAIGVAYAPTQNLNVNMKYSVTAGDVDSFAIGAGASYKFRVK